MIILSIHTQAIK